MVTICHLTEETSEAVELLSRSWYYINFSVFSSKQFITNYAQATGLTGVLKTENCF